MLLYETPDLHWYKYPDGARLAVAGAYELRQPATFSRPLGECLRFCGPTVREWFAIPMTAKCVRFEVHSTPGPDRLLVSVDHTNILVLGTAGVQTPLYINARVTVSTIMRKAAVNKVYVKCTYE